MSFALIVAAYALTALCLGPAVPWREPARVPLALPAGRMPATGGGKAPRSE